MNFYPYTACIHLACLFLQIFSTKKTIPQYLIKNLLHGGWGPPVDEVTCGGSPQSYYKCDQINMRDYMDPTLGPLPPCKQVFIQLTVYPRRWLVTKTVKVHLFKVAHYMQLVGGEWICFPFFFSNEKSQGWCSWSPREIRPRPQLQVTSLRWEDDLLRTLCKTQLKCAILESPLQPLESEFFRVFSK